MELELRTRVEVEAISSVLDEVDYYQILKLTGGSPIPAVEKAYSAQSKVFHPDNYFGVRDAKFTKAVTNIFKKINEAYQVLKDPELKRMYDKKMGFRGRGGKDSPGGGSRRRGVNKAELEAEKEALAGGGIVNDKNAIKYWGLTEIATMNKDWNGVVMNLQFALNYEPNNPILKEKLEEAKSKLAEKKAKEKNPYKIKIR
jgi:curved DNA-binding protein CbpA